MDEVIADVERRMIGDALKKTPTGTNRKQLKSYA
jgi:hypothetical protein